MLLYTPMAYEVAQVLEPGYLAYDVMDDLASFKNAPQGLRLRQRRLLAEADVVFTGGRSLHRSVSAHRKQNCHLFPSGVDVAHYARAVRLRRPRPQRVAGYVGVIDERLDLELLAELAETLPDWTIRVVGPVAKIEPDSLPQAPNLEYPGQVDYAELPAVMAEFDVALMPFALNEATRSISPTKTLEYLAAGLPVVSTRVPDVVADYSGIVHLADNAAEFAAGCQEVVQHSAADRGRRLHPIAVRQEWDTIAAAMVDLMQPAGATPRRCGPGWVHEHHGDPAGWTVTPAHRDLEQAHRRAVGAAATGLQEAHLGGLRLTGSGVPVLAETAVTSATPTCGRRCSAGVGGAAAAPAGGEAEDRCPTCGTASPARPRRCCRGEACGRTA